MDLMLGDLGKTHSKIMQLALSGPKNYYSMTGSTNAKWNAVCKQANNALVLAELNNPAHEIYSAFYKHFEKVYEKDINE